MNKQNKINELRDQGYTLSEAIQELQAEEIEANISMLEAEEEMYMQIADEAFAEDLEYEAFCAANCEEI